MECGGYLREVVGLSPCPPGWQDLEKKGSWDLNTGSRMAARHTGAACVGKPLKTSPCVQEGKEVVGANPLRPWGTGGREEETKHGQGPCSRERMSWVATWSSWV